MEPEYPALPRAWRGEPVRTAAFAGPVAVVGDIHGRADLLDRLLAQLGDLPVVAAGDVGDRGPDTRGVLDRLVARGALGVLGNHDVWLAAWAAGEGFDPLALGMGAAATLASYGGSPADVPAAHRDWLLALPIALDLRVGDTRWWVVHAGVPSDVPLAGAPLAEVVPRLAAEHPAALLWPSNDPEEMLPLDRPLVMGHRPRRRPLDTGAVLAIDTGAGKAGGRLTAVILPERRFVTVGP